MNTFQFAETFKIQPMLGPIDITTTATGSKYLQVGKQHWLTFLVSFGSVTTGTVTVTVEASTAGSSNATEAAVPFSYRVSGAVDTDSMGAITAATSAGAALAAASALNKDMLISVDPAALPVNPGADYKFVRLWFSPTSDMGACVVGASLIGQPRYPGNAIPSAT